MIEQNAEKKDLGIYPYTIKSLAIHVSAIFLILILGFISASIMKNNPGKLSLNLMQSSVRVDIVAMPKLTLNELKQIDMTTVKPSEPEEVKQKESSDNKIEEDSYLKERKKKNFLSLMKELGDKKITNSQKVDSKVKNNSKNPLSQKDKSELSSLILAGNKMSQGTSAVGDVNQDSMTKLNLYIQRLPDLIRPYWKLPSYLMDRNLKCRIRVFLSKNGNLLNAIIFETSGDEEYDNRSLAAVKKANPFPPLDDEFINKGLNGEILLGFPL